MFGTKVLMTAPAMAFLLCGTAHAALTVEQVWADLQAAATEGGITISVATEVAGDGELTLNGVTVGAEGESEKVTISELSLVEQDDGSVAFFPGEIKLEDDSPANVVITHEEFSVSVFEDDGGLGYGMYADSLKVAVDMVEGESAFNSVVDLATVTGRYTRGITELGIDMSAGKLIYNITQKDPSIGVDTVSTSDTSDLGVTGAITLPEGFSFASLQDTKGFVDAVRAGLGLRLEVTQGASVGEAVDNNAFISSSFSYASEPGVSSLTANVDTLAVSSSVAGFSLTARPPMVETPATVTADVLGIGFSMPVAGFEPSGDYGLTFDLSNMVLDDAAWATLDPAGALEHGPIDMALDLGGKIKVDLLDQIMAEEEGAPEAADPMVETLDIRNLLFKAVGATLTGTGAFTFDNANIGEDGLPTPTGTADLRLEGGNKVIDGLIALGILTDEDAMGARMLMAMFGQSEGEDIITSKVEAKADGSIFVNGQQIQ